MHRHPLRAAERHHPSDRTELKTLLDFLREGDTLCVTRVDRIARSVTDLMIIVRILEQKGVALKATEQPIDTSSAVGRSLLSMLGVFAELKPTSGASARWKSIRRIQEIDRTKPKHERTYKGRPPTIQPDEVRRLKMGFEDHLKSNSKLILIARAVG